MSHLTISTVNFNIPHGIEIAAQIECRAYLDRPVLGSGSECIGPALDQLEHLVPDILVGRLVDQTGEHLAVRLARDLIMNRCPTVLHDRLQDDQGVQSRVWIRREHFLLDKSKGVLRTGRKWILSASDSIIA